MINKKTLKVEKNSTIRINNEDEDFLPIGFAFFKVTIIFIGFSFLILPLWKLAFGQTIFSSLLNLFILGLKILISFVILGFIMDITLMIKESKIKKYDEIEVKLK